MMHLVFCSNFCPATSIISTVVPRTAMAGRPLCKMRWICLYVARTLALYG